MPEPSLPILVLAGAAFLLGIFTGAFMLFMFVVATKYPHEQLSGEGED